MLELRSCPRLASMAALCLLVACGGDDATPGTSGSAGGAGSSGVGGSNAGGTSGEGGSSGHGGTAGDNEGGTSGASGSSGASGAAGSSGTAGTSGSAGSAAGGSSGSAGTSGGAGSSGNAGSAGTSGSAGVSGSSGSSGTAGASGASGSAGWYAPPLDATWQWQLTVKDGASAVNISYDVDIYDIDLFDNPDTLFASLHGLGRKVICYFSAGSYEEWRPDANDFPAATLGNPLDGWPGERWLDIRAEGTKTVLAARLDLAVTKGCDGVEPDNVDGYSNDSGFDLTPADQITFNTWLATEAHQRGLSIGLKNDLDQVDDLVASFDFAVNEQCHAFTECDLLAPFTTAGKPIMNVEYPDPESLENAQDLATTVCMATPSVQQYTLVLPLLLDDSFRVSCD